MGLDLTTGLHALDTAGVAGPRCSTCGFLFVDRLPRHCPDCGTLWPGIEPLGANWQGTMTLGGLALGITAGWFLPGLGLVLGGGFAPFMAIVAAMMAVTLWLRPRTGVVGCLNAFLTAGYSAMTALVSSFPWSFPLGCVLIGLWLGRWVMPPLVDLVRNRLAARFHLRQREQELAARLAEIDHSHAAVNALELRLQQMAPSERLTQLRTRLRESLDVLMRQKIRFQVLRWEVAFVRWQNRVAPVAVRLSRFTQRDCEAALRLVERATAEGRALLAMIGSQTAAAASAEGRAMIEKFEQALASLTPLRDAIVAQQAQLTLSAVKPMDAPIGPTAAGMVLPAYSSDQSLEALDRAIAEADGEFVRLRIEDEIARQTQALQI